MSIAIDFFLIEVNKKEVKKKVDRSQIFCFKISGIKQGNKPSQIFHFNNSDEIKQRIKLCQIFHFNSSEVKQRSFVVRDFILIVLN